MTPEEEMRAALPGDEIMKRLSAIALETATESLAKQAEQFALTMPFEVTGRQAMKAFAAAIRSTNAKVWPSGGHS